MRQEHEVYELVISEWPNGRVCRGELTDSDKRAQEWLAAGGRVEILDHAAHIGEKHQEHRAWMRQQDARIAKIDARRARRGKTAKGKAPARLMPQPPHRLTQEEAKRIVLAMLPQRPWPEETRAAVRAAAVRVFENAGIVGDPEDT